MCYSQLQDWRVQFEQLKDFLRGMYGEFGHDDEIDAKYLQDKRIPQPLKAFYRFAGNRLVHGQKSIMFYNTIPMPWELEYSNDEVIFYIHEGRFYVWAAVGAEENPPIVKIDEYGVRTYEEERLCGFLYQVCLYEGCLSFKYNIQYFVTYDTIHDVLIPWNRFPFVTRQADDFFPNMFFYSKNALGFLWINKAKNRSNAWIKVCTFFCGAKTPQDLAFMKSFIQKMGLKDDEITSVDAVTRMETGSWEFFKNGDPCKEIDFWNTE